MFTNILTHECTLGHQRLSVCDISDTFLLGCLRYRGKHRKDILGVCCCLQTCNSVLNMLIMGFGLRQNLIVISTTGILLYAKVHISLYNVLQESLCCCLHVNYIGYKHLNTNVLSKPKFL